MKGKNTHGGARKGAGPPTKFDLPMVRHNVMLDEHTVAKARELGDGNLSAGIRIAVQQIRVTIRTKRN